LVTFSDCESKLKPLGHEDPVLWVSGM
jgi:hypothetical protein